MRDREKKGKENKSPESCAPKLFGTRQKAEFAEHVILKLLRDLTSSVLQLLPQTKGL